MSSFLRWWIRCFALFHCSSQSLLWRLVPPWVNLESSHFAVFLKRMTTKSLRVIFSTSMRVELDGNWISSCLLSVAENVLLSGYFSWRCADLRIWREREKICSSTINIDQLKILRQREEKSSGRITWFIVIRGKREREKTPFFLRLSCLFLFFLLRSKKNSRK